MVHQLFAKTVSNGRKFANIDELTSYLKRLKAYAIGKKVSHRVAAMHTGRILQLAKAGKVPAVTIA